MSWPTGTQGVFAPVNIAGVLFSKTDVRTPLFNMLGGVVTRSREFLTGAEYELDTASQPAISELASLTAPEPTYDQPVQRKNVTQIFQRAVAASYRKQSDVDSLSGLNLAGQANNVQNPLAFAIRNRTAEVRNDIEYTVINGEYSLATSNSTVDKTRGLNEAISTNVIAAAGAELGWDMLVEVARDMAHTSPFGILGVVGVLNAEQVVQLQKLVTEQGIKISPSLAGSNLYSVQTPFGELDFLRGGHRYQANGTAGFYNLGACRNVLTPVPGKGKLFWEPLAKTGAADNSQIYGQWGLDHGLEWMHAKITGLATTTSATTAPKVHITNYESPAEVS